MKNRRIDKKNTYWVDRIRRNTYATRSGLISRNFSDVEDNANSYLLIMRLVNKAGNDAAAEAKAAGLSRVYIRNYKDLVKVNAEGEEIPVVPKIKRASFYITYKPSTVLHAVNK